MKSLFKEAIILSSFLIILLLAVALLFNLRDRFDHVFFLYSVNISLSIIAIIAGWLVNKIIKTVIYFPVENYFKKTIPHLLKHSVSLTIILTVAWIIIVEIFQQPVSHYMTFTGIIGAGLAFSLKNLISDFVSSLILDAGRYYDIGDWIKIKDEKIGKVINIGWQNTIIETKDHTLVYIPNNKILESHLENYTKPDKFYWERLNITLGHEVPIGRARRLIKSAVLTIPEIIEGRCRVGAHELTTGGVNYSIKYAIKDPSKARPLRSSVLGAIVTLLHSNGLKISENLGEYALSKGGKPLVENHSINIRSILEKTSLFENLNEEEINNLIKRHTLIFKNENDELLSSKLIGEGQFYIIAEGAAALYVMVLNKDNSEKEEILIRCIYQGDHFGSSRIFLESIGEKYSIRAKTETVIIAIAKEAFLSVLKDHPDMLKKVKEDLLNEQIEMKKAAMKEIEKETLESKISEQIKALLKDVLSNNN
jgi:small-conductance mechanosensitive channel/CRP-like cAMP-binding protein